MSAPIDGSLIIGAQAADGCFLALGPPDRDGNSEVRLQDTGVAATKLIMVELPPYQPSLVEFFKEMGSEWRGWDGTKEWQNLDGELHLSCAHDGLGHVSCRTTLASVYWRWRVEVVVPLEAGGLDDLAVRAARFVNGSA